MGRANQRLFERLRPGAPPSKVAAHTQGRQVFPLPDAGIELRTKDEFIN